GAYLRTRPTVGRDHSVQRELLIGFRAFDSLPHRWHDLHESTLSLEEESYGLFVRGVQHGRGGPAPLAGFASQGNGRVADRVQRLEGELAQRRQVGRRRHPI